MSSYRSFTTLERSLASLGADVHVTGGGGVCGGKKRRNNKKRPQKPKPSEGVTPAPGLLLNDRSEGTEDGWVPVVSKKTKANALPKGADSPTNTVGPATIPTNAVLDSQPSVIEKASPSQNDSPGSTTQKKKNRKAGEFFSIFFLTKNCLFFAHFFKIKPSRQKGPQRVQLSCLHRHLQKSSHNNQLNLHHLPHPPPPQQWPPTPSIWSTS